MKLRQVRPSALIFVELSTAMGCLVAVEPRTDQLLSMDYYRCPCTMMPQSILCSNRVLILIPPENPQSSLPFAPSLATILVQNCNEWHTKWRRRQSQQST